MLLKNLALATIVTAPSPATSGTSLVVTTGEAARFPVPATDGDFYATLFPANEIPHIGNAEIVKVTAVSTDTFTIVRAQRESTAKAVEAGWLMMQGIYGEDLMSIQTGWVEIQETLTYDSPTTITVASGAPTRYQKGDKLKLTQTTVKYFYIVGVADTVLTITGGSNYTLEDEAITSPQLSRIENPFGFPGWFNWTPSYTASGSMTFTSVATSVAIFKLTANEANIICRATGTTGGTASNTISISIPVLAVDTGSNVTGASVGDPTSISGYCFVSGSNDYLSFRRYDSSNFGLGAGRVISVSPISYRY